jgi:2'-5' RNA ligase
MPGMTYNPRNELQRRVSPTALSFSSSLSTSTPPLTPITPTSTRSFSASTTTLEDYKRLQFEYPSEEPVYVLTLKTSEEIAQQMQMLRQKWFPADRLKIPAHITLFHALPESQLAQVSSHIDSIALRIKRFEISTGRIVKMKKGVLVNLEAGSDEARHIFVSLRTSWWEWLSEQDKSFKAHWTVQNKEEDQLRVDEAFRDTHRIGAGLGWATGLVLWRYEKNGMWTKAKEVEFAMSGREREPSPQQDSESDGWPVY